MSRAVSAAASYDNAKVVNRFDLTKRLVAKLKNEEAVIGGIGNTNFDLWSAGHRPQNFYMLGSMGLAIPIALGAALGPSATVAQHNQKTGAMVLMATPSYKPPAGNPPPAAGTADYVALARAS